MGPPTWDVLGGMKRNLDMGWKIYDEIQLEHSSPLWEELHAWYREWDLACQQLNHNAHRYVKPNVMKRLRDIEEVGSIEGTYFWERPN